LKNEINDEEAKYEHADNDTGKTRESYWLLQGRAPKRRVVPGAILALLPKCPVRLAAYLMMATGISISVAAAVSLRAFLIVACVSSIFLLGKRHICNLRVGA
jgi:hypothetical protein